MTLPFQDAYEALCADIAALLPRHPRPEAGAPDYLALVADLNSALQRPHDIRDILGTQHNYQDLIVDLDARIDTEAGLSAILKAAAPAESTPFGSMTADLAEIYETAAQNRILPRLEGWHSALSTVRKYLAELRASLERTVADPGEARGTIPARLALADVTIAKIVALLALSLPRQRSATPKPGRRTVSVLFIDIVGFTSMVDTLDNEEVRALQRDYFSTAADVIRRYGGVVEKYVGDAIMAIFGVGTADGCGAEDAVRAALDLQRKLDGQLLAGRWTAQFRVGVATGDAFIDSKPEIGRSFVSGSVVTTAARLQAYTPAGAVAVSARTRDMTARSIRYAAHPLSTPRVGGRAIEAWQVVGVIEGSPFDAGATGLPTPRPDSRALERESLVDLRHMVSDVTDELWSMMSDLTATTRLEPQSRRQALKVVATITERVSRLWQALSDFRGADLLKAELESTAIENLDGITWTNNTATGPLTRWPAAVRQRILELSHPISADQVGVFIIRSGTEIGMKR